MQQLQQRRRSLPHIYGGYSLVVSAMTARALDLMSSMPRGPAMNLAEGVPLPSLTEEFPGRIVKASNLVENV